MRIIFVRHGETDTNLKERQGMSITEDNAPLNATGRLQAAAVAQELRDEPVDAIFTSPYKRALETAEEIARFHDTPLVPLNDLRERSCGALVGQRFHELFDFDKDIRGNGIEPITDFFKRVYSAIDTIKSSGYRNVVIVSHGGVHHAVRAYFNGLDWTGNLRQDRMYNCDYRIYEDEDANRGAHH